VFLAHQFFSPSNLVKKPRVSHPPRSTRKRTKYSHKNHPHHKMAKVHGMPGSPPRATDPFGRPMPNPEPAPYSAWSGPPAQSGSLARKFSALALVVLLYTASNPFTPFVWVLNMSGGSLFDRLFAGIMLLSACYFQWIIANITRPLAVVLPGSTGAVLRNGRIERGATAGFVWHPSNYWPYLLCEAMMLAFAEFGPSEMLRRGIVCGVIAGLWVLGFSATPESTKRWAYDHIKSWVFWIMLDELLRVGARSQPTRRRRY
jgi:hypothetical protein